MFCIPYLCLVAALGLLAFLYSNTTKVDYKNAFVVGGTCLFLFFFGFRGYIMSDWIIYYDLFYETTIYDLDTHNLFSFNSIEPGFSLLIIFCKSLFRDFHFVVFVSTLINTILHSIRSNVVYHFRGVNYYGKSHEKFHCYLVVFECD